MPIIETAVSFIISNPQLSAGIFKGCVDFLNGHHNRELQKESEEKRRITQLQVEYLREMSQLKIAEDNRNFKRELEVSRQNFQQKMVQYECQENRKLQEFIKSVDIAINQSNQDFQAWLFEQQKKLQLELAIYNRQTQLEVASYQRETARETEEFRKLLENWPLKLVPEQIIGSHKGSGATPLRIIIAPPEIDYDRFGSATKGFPKIEKDIAQDLRIFLGQHYPLESEKQPTELLDQVWDSNRFSGGASIKALFGKLKSEPTLVIQSSVSGDSLNINVGYWSGGQDIYRYKPVLFKFFYQEVLDYSATTRALDWKINVRDKLLVKGKSLDEINQDHAGKNSNNVQNLAFLEKKEVYQRNNIKIDHLDSSFCYTKRDWQVLSQFLSAYHQFLVGLFTDIHYIILYNASPKLAYFSPDLMNHFLDEKFSNNMIEWAINCYIDVFKALESNRSHWIPDLMVEVAQGLANLENKSWSQKLVVDSIKYWQQIRGVPSIKTFADPNTMLSILTDEDDEYLDKLSHCSSILGDNHVPLADVLISTWQNLKIKGLIKRDKQGDTLF